MDESDVVSVLSTLRRPSAILLAILIILDGVTTYIGLSHRNLTEQNPVVDILIQNFGILEAILVTTIVTLIALAAHEILLARKEDVDPLITNVMGHMIFFPMNVLYGFVVFNNLLLILS